MPFDEVMHKFKRGKLRSGSKSGPKVKNRKQAVAIMLSEKKSDKAEYKSNVSTAPSKKFLERFKKS